VLELLDRLHLKGLGVELLLQVELHHGLELALILPNIVNELLLLFRNFEHERAQRVLDGFLAQEEALVKEVLALFVLVEVDLEDLLLQKDRLLVALIEHVQVPMVYLVNAHHLLVLGDLLLHLVHILVAHLQLVHLLPIERKHLSHLPLILLLLLLLDEGPHLTSVIPQTHVVHLICRVAYHEESVLVLEVHDLINFLGNAGQLLIVMSLLFQLLHL